MRRFSLEAYLAFCENHGYSTFDYEVATAFQKVRVLEIFDKYQDMDPAFRYFTFAIIRGEENHSNPVLIPIPIEWTKEINA